MSTFPHKIPRKLVLAATLTSSCITAFANSIQEPSITPEVLAESGLKAAINYPGLASLCSLEQPLKQAGSRSKTSSKRTLTDEERIDRAARSYVKPTQVFDNLYFVGNHSVASWILETSEGLILIDAMNSNNQAENIIVKGMHELGLDPENIRYLVITHAHGDHYGGQEYLVSKFAPKVVMSDRDWSELEKPVQEINNPKWGKAPSRDVTVNDGDHITLGDTTLELYVTPGHTLGTLSMIMPLRDGDDTHYGALWGGTGLNFGPQVERIKLYANSAERLRALGEEKGVDVFLSNHPTRDNSIERIHALTERKIGTKHPFVDDNALSAFELLRDCSMAQAIKVEHYQQRLKDNS